MKRLRTILLFLLLGAVVNLVVAIAACAFVPLRVEELQNDSRDAADLPCWQVGRIDRVGATFVMGMRLDQARIDDERGSPFSLHLAELRIAPDIVPLWSTLQNAPGEASQVSEVAWGWPLRTLVGRSIRFGAEVLAESPTVRFAAPTWIDKKVIAIPLSPLWGGLAVNSLLYGLVLWLLVHPVRLACRVHRRKRGHCPYCTYNLRGAVHERCPECGRTCKPTPQNPPIHAG